MAARPISPRALARLFDQTARSLHGSGFQSGLFPAQWAALRYFASAAPDQRTASALARFQGLAVGPVTRTVRTLMAKGYAANVRGVGRGRGRRVELTPAGLTLLDEDPLGIVVAAVARLDGPKRESFARGLELILRSIQAADAPPSEAAPRERARRAAIEAVGGGRRKRAQDGVMESVNGGGGRS